MMKLGKQLLFYLLIGTVLLGCRSTEGVETVVSPTPVPQLSQPTATVPPVAMAPSPTPSPLPHIDLSLTVRGVRLFPTPRIVSGDRVTFQLLPSIPQGVAPEQVQAQILVDGVEVAQGPLNGRNLYGTATGLFEWAWDTQGLLGEHMVQVLLTLPDEIAQQEIDVENNQVTFTVMVDDPASLSSAIIGADWVVSENQCCYLHTIVGTAAHRDIVMLLETTDTAVRQAVRKLDESPTNKLNIYFIDKVIGQGGYAGSDLVLSYLDRDYKGDSLYHVLVHEAVHVLDRQFAPQRIIFLAEGTAVWASEGHYKTDDLNQRMAALLQTGRYIPLTTLVNDFYPAQHEIGYLQAAGFVNYLVEEYGWERYKAFYSDVTEEDGASLADALNYNLGIHYNITLADAEADWLALLRKIDVPVTAVADLVTTIRYFDVMRQYQKRYDPAAYFLTAWLPQPHQVATKGNLADLTRHPQNNINITLELMLQAADTALRDGDYNRANVLLDSVVRVLENNGAFIDPLANNYLNIVLTTTSAGYQAQSVFLVGNEAAVVASKGDTAVLTELTLTLRGQDWVLSS